MQNNPFQEISEQLARIETKLGKIDFNLINTPPQQQPVANDLLTLEQACNKIGLAKQTVYGLVSAGKVPHMKRNKRLYFSNAELIEWIKSGKRITTDEANQIVNNYLTSKSN
jgi:excisionase family DNA binding protein